MPFVAKQVRPEGGRPPLMGSALGSEGHGTPPRLGRGYVPYYQHTSNDSRAAVTVEDEQTGSGAEGLRSRGAKKRRGGEPFCVLVVRHEGP